MSADPTVAPDAAFAAVVDDLRRTPDGAAGLARLLPENLPWYTGRAPAQTTRMRGRVLAAFAETGLPDAALPFVREALETGVEPYEVAGAAVALRGCSDPPDGVLPLLLEAVHRIAGVDVTVDLTSPPTTALQEIVRTIGCFPDRAAAVLPRLERLAAAQERFPEPVLVELRRVVAAVLGAAGRPRVGSCCGSRTASTPAAPSRTPSDLGSVVLEDQDGRTHAFADCFRGQAAVITFFYTRCDNPYKCSATIGRLAELQRALAGPAAPRPVRLAAITYDPDFDVPSRLRRYGTDRGVVFGDDVRFYRATAGFESLRSWLDLGVNYGASTVNRHRIEAYVLDAGGAVTATFARAQWQVDAVLRALVPAVR